MEGETSSRNLRSVDHPGAGYSRGDRHRGPAARSYHRCDRGTGYDV